MLLHIKTNLVSLGSFYSSRNLLVVCKYFDKMSNCLVNFSFENFWLSITGSVNLFLWWNLKRKPYKKNFFSRKIFANSSRHNSILRNNVKEFSYQSLKIQSQSLKILQITCHISFCMCPQCFFNLESFRCVIHWRVALLSRWSLSKIKKRYSYEISRRFDCLFPNNSK